MADTFDINGVRDVSVDNTAEIAKASMAGQCKAQFGGAAAVDLKSDPALSKLFNAANPSVTPNQPEVKAEVTPATPEPTGQKMTIETARTCNADIVAAVGDQLKHEGQTGGGTATFGECLGIACNAISKATVEPKSIIEANQAQLVASVAMQPKPELDVQKTYTPDLTMKPTNMMA